MLKRGWFWRSPTLATPWTLPCNSRRNRMLSNNNVTVTLRWYSLERYQGRPFVSWKRRKSWKRKAALVYVPFNHYRGARREASILKDSKIPGFQTVSCYSLDINRYWSESEFFSLTVLHPNVQRECSSPPSWFLLTHATSHISPELMNVAFMLLVPILTTWLER